MSDPFEERVVAAVARERGVDPAALRELVERHQASVRDSPGVDDLVYEWRRYLPYDPLVARTDEAFVCVVFASIWEEFADGMGIEDDEREALMAVHRRQARRLADVDEDAEAVVLTRT